MDSLNETMLSIKSNDICRVCGDRAFIVNYGAITCLPCRTFFRRNSHCPEELRICCHLNYCKINLTTRKVCPSCRLKKCFAVGMKTNLIRKKDITKKTHKPMTVTNEEGFIARIPQESALDHRTDGFYLNPNASDRILISNIVHAFDVFSPVNKIRFAIELLKRSPSNIQFNVTQAINVFSISYSSLQSFITSIPDFKVLTSTEQRSLFQRNLIGVLTGGSIYLAQESGVFDEPQNALGISLLYGENVTQRVKLLIQKLPRDSIMSKIMLVALTFSSNCYLVANYQHIESDSLLLGTFRLFGSQNVYVEILWKYLVYKYGLHHAVLIFSKLINTFLDAFSISMDVYQNNRIQQALVDNLVSESTISSIVNSQTKVPLWGKQTLLPFNH